MTVWKCAYFLCISLSKKHWNDNWRNIFKLFYLFLALSSSLLIHLLHFFPQSFPFSLPPISHFRLTSFFHSLASTYCCLLCFASLQLFSGVSSQVYFDNYSITKEKKRGGKRRRDTERGKVNWTTCIMLCWLCVGQSFPPAYSAAQINKLNQMNLLSQRLSAACVSWHYVAEKIISVSFKAVPLSKSNVVPI